MSSINFMLKFSFGLCSAIIMCILAIDSWSAWKDVRAHDDLSYAARASSELFLTLANHRADASVINGLLKKENPVTDIPGYIKPMRERKWQGAANGLDALKQFDFPDKDATIAYLEEAFKTLKTLEDQATVAIGQPMASRPATLAKDYAAKAREFQEKLNLIGKDVQVRLLLSDPMIDKLITLHKIAWTLRVSAGSAQSVITDNIPIRGDIPANALAAQQASFSRLDTLAEIINEQIKSIPVTPKIKVAVDTSKNVFFDPAFRQLQVDALQKLLANEKPSFTRDEWDAKTVPILYSLTDVAAAFIDGASEVAETTRAEAFKRLQVSISFLAASILFTVVIFFIINRRLIRPISALTFSMRRIADGALDTEIPGIKRADEIGDMANAVDVFRQGALRNVTLEREAEENRVRAEREKIEAQIKAEAAAEDRLNQTTAALGEGLKRLASGDMLCEIVEEFTPQFEALRRDFNTSVVQLREALLAVGTSVTTVTAGSSEISQASDDLAKRTEQQAASIEETAASLEQITSNVRSTSQRTLEARSLVTDARKQADEASGVVTNAVAAMDKIERSAHQINQNIGVIDEIAFQTNLLALNAGVEAARAGEAGKGFAVVAQEVRELAQRSANAAKEIKGLIRDSEAAVTEGVKLVSSSGEGLNVIARIVQSIDAHMGEIASASQDQSINLNEVNTAVNHMDKSTQQNAAMVEEMNAASAQLAKEAQNLAATLQRFRTSHNEITPGSRSGYRRGYAA